MNTVLKPDVDVKLTVADVRTGEYTVNWLRPIGTTGMPWSGGQLYLERNPKYHPIVARGQGEPGLFWEIQYLPQVQAALRRPLRAILSLPYRVEPTEPPEWASDEDYAAAERHWELGRRVFDRLSRDRQAFTKMLREFFSVTVIGGSYLGELVCDEVVYDYEGPAFRYWVPRHPELRAPWTIQHWLTQAERPIGVVLNSAAARDFTGGGGPSYAVIPWRKLIHVAAEFTGSNLEGVSWLRPVVNLVKMLQQAYQTLGLANEINGIGELWFTLPEGMSAADPVAQAFQQHIRLRKSGQSTGGVAPHGTSIQTISPQQTMPNMEPTITALTKDILLGMDSIDTTIATDGTGSYAAKVEGGEEFRDGLDYIAQEYAAFPIEQILRKAIEINYPEDMVAGRVYCPTVQWGVVEERDNDTYINTLVVAYQGGLLTEQDMAVARPMIRELLDLPEPRSEGEAGADATGESDDLRTGRFQDTASVAKIFGVRASTINGWRRRGKIEGRKIAGRWRIDVGSVRALISGVDPVADAAEASDAPTGMTPIEQVQQARLALDLLSDPSLGPWAREVLGAPEMTPDELAQARAAVAAKYAAASAASKPPAKP